MPKIQGHNINQKQCVPICEGEQGVRCSQREYSNQRIVKAFVQIQTPAFLALGPEAEILKDPDGTLILRSYTLQFTNAADGYISTLLIKVNVSLHPQAFAVSKGKRTQGY
jgi:hypothetical protein